MAPKKAKKGAARTKKKAAPKKTAKRPTPKRATKAVKKKAPKKPATKPRKPMSIKPSGGKPPAMVKPAGTPKIAPAKGAPAPELRVGKGAKMKGAPTGKAAGKAGKGGTPGRPGENGEHEGMEFEAEPPVVIAAAEPHIPTPSRRKPKPGSPDWPGDSLTVGMEAPAFNLPSTLGRKVTLAEFRGRRVVLYFYPKDDTPGCTMEACAFRDNLARITAKDAVILGISMDDELSHQRFVQKYNLTFPLLSDVDAAVCRQYGTYKEKNLYGRTFWGVERTTFVIDREGKVENVFRRVKVEGHADEVLATLSV